jgi:hypothetical protein
MRTSFSVIVLMVSALATGDPTGGRLAAQQAARDAALTCATADSRLRACLPFDGDARDRSSYGNHAHAGNVSYVPGKSGQAARFNEQSRMLIAQSPSLELQQLTVKFWVRPVAFPTGPGEEPRMGLIDGEATFRIYIHEKGIVRCSMTGRPEAFSKVALPLNEWTRVACTFDGKAMRLYFNGEMVAETVQNGRIAQSIASMAIGHDFPSSDNLLGDIDQLELWNAVVAP